MIDKAYLMLHTEIHQYRSGRFKKWICLAFGLAMSIVISLPTTLLLQSVLFAKYDRVGLETVGKKLLSKDLMFDKVGNDPGNELDLLIPAFEFNQNEPRFFSKYFNRIDPGIYQLPFWEAVASSSSAPFYFDPMSRTDGYGFDAKLIDGGIICNNPSLYAYYYAKYLIDKPKIRIISLGTGNHTQDYYDRSQDKKESESVFKLSTIRSVLNFDWMMNFDSVASDKVLESFMMEDEYVRANVPTKQDLDTYSDADIVAMKE